MESQELLTNRVTDVANALDVLVDAHKESNERIDGIGEVLGRIAATLEKINCTLSSGAK